MNLINRILLIILPSFIFAFAARTQVIVTTPGYPVDVDSVTIIFDATRGDAGLNNVAPPIYAHTGVITNLSSSPSDWRYVIADWNQNLPKALMTPLGNNLYQLKIKPAIRSWYGVPQNEKILKMAFVFRNTDGSKTGRDTLGGDIFANVYLATTGVTITQPATPPLLLLLNDTIPVSAISPLADTLSLLVNNVLIKKVAGQHISDTLLADNFGNFMEKQWVKIVAKNDTASAADSFYYSVLPNPPVAALPPGTQDGINYIDSTHVILSLFAPSKEFCFLIGDFNNWQMDTSWYMNKTPDGTHYWFEVKDLTPRKEYIFQYLVNGTLRIADPYTDKVSDPDDKYISAATYPNLIQYPTGKTTEIASVLQTAQEPYHWNTTSFTPPKTTDLVIYELLIRDFMVKHDYPSLIDTLDYLKRLGINAIELMPVMEFEGNSSWGYNPDFEFAPDKYYGTKNGLKQFVEAAHAKGFAVILDIVLNHQFGQSPLARLYWDNTGNHPAANNPWFNQVPKHPFNVGNDFNHQSPYTQAYSQRLLKYWVTEYHVDGYRLDLSKGLTQVNSYPDNYTLMAHKDPARIAVLNTYYNTVRSVKPSIIFILEHFADNDEETELSADGMLLWGNSNYNYTQATEGYTANNASDFSWVSYEKRGWADPHLVGYMESHDEERLMYNNVTNGNHSASYSCKDTSTALKRVGMAATFFYTIPGPKMLWQFGELGYDYSINYPSGTSDSRLAPKPIRWDYYQQWRRRYLYNVCASLIDLRKNHPAFESTDYTLNVNGAMKTITIRSSEMDVVIVGNFDLKTGSVIPGFTKTGTWYDYFSGDSILVNTINERDTLEAGEYHLYTTKKLAKPLFTGIDDALDPLPGTNRLSMVYPNPSTDRFTILFSLSASENVTLTVFDIFGKKLTTLENRLLSPGMYHVTWNAVNVAGQKAAPGVYFYRLTVGNRSETGKLIVE
jgi:glycosidase